MSNQPTPVSHAQRDRLRKENRQLREALAEIADGYERHNPGWWIKKAKAALAGKSPSSASLPESVCRHCGGPNVVWFAPSPLWNAVMRGGSIANEDEYAGIVCPTCFAVLAEERGVSERWRLAAEVVHVELETTTPSGRVYDFASDMWVDVA